MKVTEFSAIILADSFADGTLLRTFTGNGSSLTDTFTVALGQYRYLDINANFANVLIDNGASAAVPLPPSVLLMGSGLLGLAVMRYRRRA